MEVPEFLTLNDLASIEQFDARSSGFRDAVANPQTQTEVLEALAELDLPYTVNSAMAGNRNVSHHTLQKLAGKARHRWEWRAINAGFRRLSSDISAYDENTPYAPSIVGKKLENPSDAAAYFCQTGTAIAEDLWHDLATREIIRLDYESDTVDGDHFGPIYEDKVRGFAVHTPAEYLLGRASSCSWIEQVPDPDQSYIEETMVEEFEAFTDDMDNVIDRIQSPIMLLLAAAQGLTNGHLEISDAATYRVLMIDAMEDYSPEQLDKAVEIISEPDHLNGPRYGELSDVEREILVTNLILASQHYVHLYFKTTAHLLNLILLHPETAESARQKIQQANVPGTEWTIQE